MGGLVCVQMIPQGEEGLGSQRIFSLQVYLPQAAHQTLITDIVAFSFSNDRPDGGLDQLIRVSMWETWSFMVWTVLLVPLVSPIPEERHRLY